MGGIFRVFGMLSLVSHVDSFCNFALEVDLEVGSSALLSECHLWLLFAPAGCSTAFPYVMSAPCIISRLQLS